MKTNNILQLAKKVVKDNPSPNGLVVWQHPTKPQFKIVAVERGNFLQLQYIDPRISYPVESDNLFSRSGRGGYGSMLTNSVRAKKYTDIPKADYRYQVFIKRVKSALRRASQ